MRSLDGPRSQLCSEPRHPGAYLEVNQWQIEHVEGLRQPMLEFATGAEVAAAFEKWRQ